MITTAPRRSWVEQIMGMPISLLARGAEALAPAANAAADALFGQLRAVDAMFSPYLPDSELSRFTRGELTWADCGPDVRDVAARTATAREQTGGLFDASRPDGMWDPSGLVKGWAVERAAHALFARSTLDWCVNAGGDVVVRSVSGEPFTIGIQDPLDHTRVATAVALVAGAVATSGTAVRGSHLYDPRTGAAARDWLSVSVRGPSLETADVLATAAFVAGADWMALIEGHPGYTGLAIGADGAQHTTPGWSASAPGPVSP